MKNKKRHVPLFVVAIVLASVGAIMHPPRRLTEGTTYQTLLPAPTTVQAGEVSAWTLGVRKVKEDRGEPTGKEARIDVPSELRHYRDSRRFLAVQVAESRQHQFSTPADFVELAEMIGNNELMPVEPVSESHILFGVGASATAEPFGRYENGRSVPLYDQIALAGVQAKLSETHSALRREIESLRKQIELLRRGDRSRRAAFSRQIVEKETAVSRVNQERKTLDRYYNDEANRAELFNHHQKLSEFARSFDDRSYDLQNAQQRRALKQRMLAYLRPEASAMLNEIADSYYKQFSRPLPVTSLVRPHDYQYTLSKSNPNATQIDTPPHSTGLAFDILYRYMTAAEQEHVMTHLAKLEKAGRIEVLRENRDHFHVFAFIDGARPAEKFIGASLGRIGGKTGGDSKTVGKAFKAKKRVRIQRRRVR